jgi:hypothetical protein
MVTVGVGVLVGVKVGIGVLVGQIQSVLVGQLGFLHTPEAPCIGVGLVL